METLAALKPQLREQLALFSQQLTVFQNKHAPGYALAGKQTNTSELVPLVSHEAKEMAYAYSAIDGMRRLKPEATEADIIREVRRQYVHFGTRLHDIGVGRNVPPADMQPMTDIIHECVRLCDTALASIAPATNWVGKAQKPCSTGRTGGK